MTLRTITDATFTDDVLRAPMPVLVDFTADWCPPCVMIAPVLERIAHDEADRMTIVSLDVDSNPSTAARYQVLGMPTLALFKDGEIVARLMGAKPRTAILRELEPHLRARAVTERA
jgi:thioredoxin 1